MISKLILNMIYRTCKSCKMQLPLENFKIREDRKGSYAMCNICRCVHCREDGYPPIIQSGGGRLYIDWEELD